MSLHPRLDPLMLMLAATDQGAITVPAALPQTAPAPRPVHHSVAPLLVGVDLGGTQTRAAVVRGAEIVARVKRPTPAADGPDAVIAAIIAAVREALELAESGESEIGGIGVSAPGPLNPRTGIVYESPNLAGFINIALRDEIARGFNSVPVFIGHDATLAGYAEYRFGAGRDAHHVIYLTISTGIGGGIIDDDRIVEGVSGTAGEVGHMYIDPRPDAPRCGAGHAGCLEALASGTAIARDANALIAAGHGLAIVAAHQEMVAQHSEALEEEAHAASHVMLVGAREVEEAAMNGDPEAIELLRHAGEFIGIGCVNLLHILNPERIVIGGGVTKSGPLLFDPILATIQARAFARPAQDVQVVPAALGDDGGLIGAAAYVEYMQQRGAR